MYKVHSNYRKFICELNGKFYELPCKWLKIYEDDILIRHFEACLNENNQIGYYEYVLGKFFLPEKPIKEVSIFDVYRLKQYNIYPCDDQLMYLDDNAQYIDIGVNPNQTSLFDEIMNKNDFIGKSDTHKTK